MSNLTRDEVVACLRELGWRVRSGNELDQAIKHFQGGWALGPALDVDGQVGPESSEALRQSVRRKRSGQSTASSHFSFAEVACKCGGAFTTCARIWLTRETFVAMESYRLRKGSGFVPVSGCRCPGHNARVGGASQSQHMRGVAFDTPAEIDKDRVRSWRVFTGIGYNRSSDRTAHCDLRPGSVDQPTTWVYGR